MLTACFSTGPINNEDFVSIRKINDLNGMYKNRGDSGTEGPDIYLSKIIWPNDEDVDHKSIEIVAVRSISEVQLSVKALQDNTIVKEQIFIEGEDFNIRSGRIQLVRDLGGVNDNIAGATYTNVDIGLDASGHGKYRRGETFAGIVLLIPMVAHGTTDVRFIKIEE